MATYVVLHDPFPRTSLGSEGSIAGERPLNLRFGRELYNVNEH